MANEAVLKNRLEEPISFTASTSAAFEKGTLCKLSDPRTVAASDTEGEKCAGITAREKISASGEGFASIFLRGVFDMYASGSIGVGAPIMSAGVDNEVKEAAVDSSGSAVIGYALEAATDKETIHCMINIGAGNASVS